ncbi:MAG: ketol-acid reductoisomerase, partial [Candidatus Bathyarchaeia archaeon]
WKERFRSATQPVFDSLYELVAAGEETRIVLEKSKAADYRQKLADELKAMGSSEMWRAGETVRSLRPKQPKKE